MLSQPPCPSARRAGAAWEPLNQGPCAGAGGRRWRQTNPKWSSTGTGGGGAGSPWTGGRGGGGGGVGGDKHPLAGPGGGGGGGGAAPLTRRVQPVCETAARSQALPGVRGGECCPAVGLLSRGQEARARHGLRDFEGLRVLCIPGAVGCVPSGKASSQSLLRTKKPLEHGSPQTTLKRSYLLVRTH